MEQAARGVGQYVILGAGLDTFAQRRPELASRLRVFEVDQPGPQAWKRQRLIELGFGIPAFLRLVPVDFEAGDAWWERLAAAGFDAGQPAVVASTGVSMYLTKDAIAATLRQVAALAPGSTLVMSFLLPIELADPEVRPGLRASGGGGARQRHAVHQLLHADGDARAGPRSRLSRGPARVGSRSRPALLRGQDRWPSPAQQFGGAAGRDDLVGRSFPASLLPRLECAAELVGERSEPLRRRNVLAFGVLAHFLGLGTIAGGWDDAVPRARAEPSGTSATPIRFFSRSMLRISKAAVIPDGDRLGPPLRLPGRRERGGVRQALRFPARARRTPRTPRGA